ncbi:MAG: DUF2004 domain-containing protein [Myxococcales bacterium]|nr:DUF2004 domain-containing protein [Myxococcales bacterium]
MAVLQHPVFGKLTPDATGGVCRGGTRPLATREVAVDLTLMGPAPAAKELLDRAAPFIARLATFDTEARAGLEADQEEDDSAVVLYLEHHIEELEPGAVRAIFGKPKEEVDMAAFLAAVYLRRVGLHPDDADRFAVFDYTISDEETHYVLSVAFDVNGEIVAVDMES